MCGPCRFQAIFRLRVALDLKGIPYHKTATGLDAGEQCAVFSQSPVVLEYLTGHAGCTPEEGNYGRRGRGTVPPRPGRASTPSWRRTGVRVGSVTEVR